MKLLLLAPLLLTGCYTWPAPTVRVTSTISTTLRSGDTLRLTPGRASVTTSAPVSFTLDGGTLTITASQPTTITTTLTR